MEQAEIYKHKLNQFRKALDSFEKLLNYDETSFDDIAADGLRNGRLQKFEYCTELLWKTIRSFLFYKEGVESNSPKSSIKQIYTTGNIEESDYESLLEMIDDRNRLSHIYDENQFNSILSKLRVYLEVMNRLLSVLDY